MMIQYIVKYPEGYYVDAEGTRIYYQDMALTLIKELEAGKSVATPDTWTVQTVVRD